MPDIHVYINNDLFYHFKNLENKSAVISMLLEKYFQEKVKPDIKEISSELENLDSRKKVLEEKKTEIIVEKKAEELSEKQRIDSEESRVKSKIESIRKTASGFFSEFVRLELAVQDRLIDDYLNNNPNDLNLILFLNSRGLKDNIPEENGKSV